MEENPYTPPETEAPAEVPELATMDLVELDALRKDSLEIRALAMMASGVGILTGGMLVQVLVEYVGFGFSVHSPLEMGTFGAFNGTFLVLSVMYARACLFRPAWYHWVSHVMNFRRYRKRGLLAIGVRSSPELFARLFGPRQLRHGDIEHAWRRRKAVSEKMEG